MVCSHCHGQRWLMCQGRPYPCPECGGQGGNSCCDGLMEVPFSPETVADSDSATVAPSLTFVRRPAV